LEDTAEGSRNVFLENNVTMASLGDDYQSVRGRIDYLLLDNDSRPLVVLEAKSESIEPLSAKEQARAYAESKNAKYIILSNGNVHYLWSHLEHGNPERINAFPTLQSFQDLSTHATESIPLHTVSVEADYIAVTQMHNYAEFPEYQDEAQRPDFIKNNKLRFLRHYQISAVKSIQERVRTGGSRFLLEMATGTGKTLTAAAIIKLFYKTKNARRILFLVDRLELEEQARKDFETYLKNDMRTLIYKENKTDWRMADIVVTTIQSLLVNNKYRRYFSPTDFELVISDEAHRLLGGGNSRALFEYFMGYKLGLTATPKDYLKNIDTERFEDPRELERRRLLDTYTTFGCDSGTPTFRYSLADGAKDKILIQPTVVDARTDVTTQLLSDEGYTVLLNAVSQEGAEITEEISYYQNQFERKFFSDVTNRVFVKTFLDNGKLDPISHEFGKSLVFAVSQNHAAKLTQMLNEYANQKWPNRYRSDFAMQVTSNVVNSQQMTVDFSNDKLRGTSKWTDDDDLLRDYKTSRARVCVTVGMMTTGWDCPNILNLAIMRPIFSPTEFIQIKGRGTRINTFECITPDGVIKHPKDTFKLFDFFAVCEYFEEKYNYDQVIELPRSTDEGRPQGPEIVIITPREGFNYSENDAIRHLSENPIGVEGMKVDNKFFQSFETTVRSDSEITRAVEEGNIETAISLTQEKFINTTKENYTVDRLTKALKIDRKISLREILEQIFHGAPIKGKDELITEEFEKFLSTIDVSEIGDAQALRFFFTAYLTDAELRRIIDNKEMTDLYHNPSFGINDYKRVPDPMREKIPTYIKTYIPTDIFIAA